MTSLTKPSCLFLTICFATICAVGFYQSRWSTKVVADVKKMSLTTQRVDQAQELQESMISTARRRNNDRKARLKKACRRIGGGVPPLTATSTAYDHVIVDREHRIMYCPVPKAACTTWKAFFMELRGVKLSNDIHTMERTSVLHLKDLDPIERESVMKSYTKFLIVRHPFTRILSAYRNKIEPNGTFEAMHTNISKKFYWRKRIGAKILTLYRGKETAKRYAEHPEEYELTFREFVDYISTHKNKTYASDRHWREMFEICYPCDIEYDYIAKFETLQEDSIFFLVSNGFSSHLTNYAQHATNSSSSAFSLDFFNQLPVESINNLYERYKFDFQLFDYDPRNLT